MKKFDAKFKNEKVLKKDKEYYSKLNAQRIPLTERNQKKDFFDQSVKGILDIRVGKQHDKNTE